MVVVLELPVVEMIEGKLVVEDLVLLAITSVPETTTMAITRRPTKASVFFNFGYASTKRIIEMVKVFESREVRCC